MEGAGAGNGILQLLNDPEEEQDKQEEQKEEKREVEEQVEFPLHGAVEAIPHEVPREASCSREGVKSGCSAAPGISSPRTLPPLSSPRMGAKRRRRGKDRQKVLTDSGWGQTTTTNQFIAVKGWKLVRAVCTQMPLKRTCRDTHTHTPHLNGFA